MPLPKNPGLAAISSAVVPGLGQFYNGDFWRGIFWLIITPGMWIGTGGLLGWVCHVIAAVTAYHRSESKNRAVGVTRHAQRHPRCVVSGLSRTSAAGPSLTPP